MCTNWEIKRKDLPFREIEGETFIVTPENTTLHTLNFTASTIWKFIEEKHTFSEIINFLQNNFKVSEDILRKDIKELLLSLKEKKLINIKEK